MSDEHRTVKRTKSISSYFSRSNPQTSLGSSSQASVSTPIAPQQSTESPLFGSRRNEYNPHDNINAIERDPGLRCPLWKYPANERDSVRRAYVSLGPCQPKLKAYPLSDHGSQKRRFNSRWYENNRWLEYSEDGDSIFCFPCFLFEKEIPHHPAFTVGGSSNWKSKDILTQHTGHIDGAHQEAMEKWNFLRNNATQIERVFVKRTAKDVEDNRFRLKASIEGVRYLANQGQAFRGHDESESSLNAGGFQQIRKSFVRMAREDDKVVLSGGPGNAKYTAHSIQRELLDILGDKVRRMIREEIGDAKFCILVDEAVDAASKEQMAIILRFVDRMGIIRERFFKIVSVPNTTSLALKMEIAKVLAMYNLQLENLRGQGYDGASNMSGIWNGLQALFLEECPYAYYVHCFAHRLQLSLSSAAKGIKDVWRFFSTLLLIVTFVDSSAKRHCELKTIREEEVQDLVALGLLETGRGANQTCTLQRPGTTRWGSHFHSIKSLIELFSSTLKTLTHMTDHGSFQGEASGVLTAMRNFEFVFCLILMNKIMQVTEILCQALQRKSLDIIEALNFVTHTKELLQEMREDGWSVLKMSVATFCETHNLDIPDMSAPYKDGTGRSCQQMNFVTVEHHYHIDVFNAALDFQLSELNRRFPEGACQLLALISTLDPYGNFRSFKTEKVILLARDSYPADFEHGNLLELELECAYYHKAMTTDLRFGSLDSMSDLCQKLVQTRKSDSFPMMYRLICLVSTLPVSTATTERAFSAMNIIKNRRRSKMDDDFLDDCMVLHIEKEFADAIENDDVIKEFEASGSRRVRFS